MISVVIPTRNRAYILKEVLESYYIQKKVTEIIIVDDFSTDNTEKIANKFSNRYLDITTKYIRNDSRCGASAGRVAGYNAACNDFIIFGEDDVYLEKNYSEVLFNKLLGSSENGIVSGRIIYKLFHESNEIALNRFGVGFENTKVFNSKHFGIEVNAIFEGDKELPFTHAVFLTRKDLLKRYGYDPFYNKGNGYREETDFQVNLFINNKKIICTNETHCFHVSRQEIKSGGQRINRIFQLYWNIYFTKYFFDKYYDKLMLKLDLKYNKLIALIIFSFSMFKVLFIKPIVKIPTFFIRWIQR